MILVVITRVGHSLCGFLELPQAALYCAPGCGATSCCHKPGGWGPSALSRLFWALGGCLYAASVAAVGSSNQPGPLTVRAVAWGSGLRGWLEARAFQLFCVSEEESPTRFTLTTDTFAPRASVSHCCSPCGSPPLAWSAVGPMLLLPWELPAAPLLLEPSISSFLLCFVSPAQVFNRFATETPGGSPGGVSWQSSCWAGSPLLKAASPGEGSNSSQLRSQLIPDPNILAHLKEK